jgi:hypothetical protein
MGPGSGTLPELAHEDVRDTNHTGTGSDGALVSASSAFSLSPLNESLRQVT